jgi:hypothetical protein
MLPRGSYAGGWILPAVLSAAVVLGASSASAQEFVPRSEARYAGPATLVVHHLDDTGAHLETRTYHYDAIVLVGPPRRYGREEEDNPVHLEITAPSASARIEDGRLGMTSASTIGGLRRHWTLTLEDNRIEGRLTDEEQGTLTLILDEENHLNTRRTMGYTGFATTDTGYDTLAFGSTLDGTVGEERVTLRLEGNVTNGDRVFAFEIDASRVDALGRPQQPEAEAAPEPEAAQQPAPAAGNPLATTGPFVGRFEGDGLVLKLDLLDGRHVGELEYGLQRFPVAATTDGATLRGTFESAGQRFAFEATRDDETLVFTTDGAVYRLVREAPRNPLGQ